MKCISNFWLNCFKLNPAPTTLTVRYCHVLFLQGSRYQKVTLYYQIIQCIPNRMCPTLQRMTDKCFKKCIGKPGNTLDNSEQVGVTLPMPLSMFIWEKKYLNPSVPLLFVPRNALPCVWTDIWTHGTRSPVHIIPDYKGKGHVSDVQMTVGTTSVLR